MEDWRGFWIGADAPGGGQAGKRGGIDERQMESGSGGREFGGGRRGVWADRREIHRSRNCEGW